MSVFELTDYLTIIRQRKWTIVAIVVATVTAAAVWSSGWVPVYQSQARVLVENTQPTSSPTTTTFVNLGTEAQLASSEEVAALAGDELGLEGPAGALRAGLSVTPETETQILNFGYTALTPKVARDRAQAFATAYIEFRERELLDRALAAQEPLRNAIAEKEGELDEAEEQLAATDDPVEEATLRQQIESLGSDIDFLEQQQLLQTPPGEIEVGMIIEDAQLPGGPVSSGRVRILVLALIAGLALGVGVVFLRERLDQSLRSRDDLESHVGAPVLTVVPRVRAWRHRDDPYLVTLEEFDSAAAEAYRTLRIGLMFAASNGDGASTILITSAEAGEGKSTTTANLGVAYAAAGKSVAVVSADLRRPRLDAFLHSPSSKGLTNVLAGEIELEKALRSVRGAPNLKLLPSGPIPGNPAELLSSTAMVDLLERLGRQFEVVLIDTAPVLAVSDAIAIAPHVDGVLIVADATASKRRAQAQAARSLRQVNARILGAVLGNASGVRWSSQAGYYHAYGSHPSEAAGGNGAKGQPAPRGPSRRIR